MATFPDIVLVAGSPSQLSRSAAALEYIAHVLHQGHHSTYIVFARDIVASALAAPIPGENAAVRQVADAVQGARAVIVATPIYKAAYSGILKTLLDFLPEAALTGKIVLPVATGGSLAHLLAIDYALKPVLSALGARHILQGAYLTDAQITRLDSGDKTAYSTAFRIDETGEARLLDGVNSLLRLLYTGDNAAPRPFAETGKDWAFVCEARKGAK